MVSSLATLTILALAFSCAVVRADVSHLGYSRYSRPASTRLQRLEGGPTPYPAAGYRPNKEFNLPREQPIFPIGNNQQPQENNQFSSSNNNNNGGFNSNNNNPGFNSNNNNGGFEVLSEPQQPSLTYGTPSRFRQVPARVQQQQQVYTAPQLTYGAPQQQEQPQTQTQSQPQPQPEGQSQNTNSASGFNNLAEPQQRPDLLYGAPSRFRQAPARVQQQQPGRLTGPQSGRFTDNREDEEDDEDTTNPEEEIETENKKDEGKKTPAQNVAIAYYPAGAFSFVQPVGATYVAAAPSAAYVTGAPGAAYLTAAPSATYVTAPSSAAYVTAPNAAIVTAPKTVYQPSQYLAASPFVQQPFTFGAAPAQFRAW